jgi:hypothetical protein
LRKEGLDATAGDAGGKANAGGCWAKGKTTEGRSLVGGGTVEAEERLEASAAEEPNSERFARGWMGETKPEGAETTCLGCLDLCLDEPRAEEEETGRRGNRSPADGMELEFVGSRDEVSAGREESGAEEEEALASTMVLVLGILNRKEKRNKAGMGPRSEEKKERKAEKAKPIDRIDLYLLWV